MDNKVTIQQATDLIVELIGFGRNYYVDDDMMVKNKKDETVAIKLSSKTKKPLMVFHEGMPVGEFAVLNPYVENYAKSAERDWFFQVLNVELGAMIREMMIKSVELACSKDTDAQKESDEGYGVLEIITPFIDKMDEKMVSEIDSLGAIDFTYVEYNKKKKTARLTTCLYDESVMKSAQYSKIRKKAWAVMQGLFETFLQIVVDDPDTDVTSAYSHKGKIVGMQETESTLAVVIKVLEAIAPSAKVLLDHDINVGSLVKHLDRLEAYQKVCKWYVPASAEDETDSLEKPPWAREELPTKTQFSSQQVQTVAQPQPQQQQVQQPTQQAPTQQQPIFTPSASLQSKPIQQPQQQNMFAPATAPQMQTYNPPQYAVQQPTMPNWQQQGQYGYPMQQGYPQYQMDPNGCAQPMYSQRPGMMYAQNPQPMRQFGMLNTTYS